MWVTFVCSGQLKALRAVLHFEDGIIIIDDMNLSAVVDNGGELDSSFLRG